MQDQGISELDAALQVAAHINAQRRRYNLEETL